MSAVLASRKVLAVIRPSATGQAATHLAKQDQRLVISML